MHHGTRVSLHGLQSRPELNGQPATLIRWDADAGRWSVRIAGSDERMRVKPSCIKLVSAKQLQEVANEVFEAARRGDAGRLSKLLASSPAVAWGDISDGGTGTTVLAVAAKGGHAKCVALLLEGKPNIRATDSFGQAAVHCAAESGSADALQLLLDAGASPCDPDGQGQTPLHFAAEEGRVECARLLLQAGASASAVYRGATPYQWAVNGGHTDCANLLKGLSSLSSPSSLSGRSEQPATHSGVSTHAPFALLPGSTTPPAGAVPMDRAQMRDGVLDGIGMPPTEVLDPTEMLDALHRGALQSDAEAQAALASLMRGLQDGSLQYPEDDPMAEYDGQGF